VKLRSQNVKSRDADHDAGRCAFLAAEQEPPFGSHVVTPRRGHLHHGIYVGGGKVVHYAGLARGLHRGALEEVVLAPFTQGRCLWIRSHALPSFDCREVIRRTRIRP
jgi:hypothetical protein